jgi:hypothetical protein
MTDAFRPPTHANDNIDPDAPLRLEDAVRLCFPHGGMTVSGLRHEAKAGRLVIEKIANKHFTTPRAIEEMRKLCRVNQSLPVFGRDQPREIAIASGSSSMVEGKLALAAARMTVQALKNSSTRI